MKPSTLTCDDVGRLLYLLFETSLFHIFPFFSALAIYSPFIFSEALEFFTTPLSLCVCFVYIYIYMKSSFPKRDKRHIKKNEFVMPFCCVLNLFTAPSMFHAKSLYFLA